MMSVSKDEIVKQRDLILGHLRKNKITRVIISYDGSGDSGSVQSVQGFKLNRRKEEKEMEPTELRNIQLQWSSEEGTFVQGEGWKHSAVVRTTTLDQVLDNFACNYLDYESIDWCNNEGGYGEVIIDTKKGSVRAEHNTRFESSEYSEHKL